MAPSLLSRALPRPFLLHVRALSAAARPPAAFHVVGAGTDIGKTVLSGALARAAADHGSPLSYIKPVQSGHPPADDAAFVLRASGGRARAETLVALRAPASPDLAAALQGGGPSDARVLALVRARLRAAAAEGRVALVEGAGGVLSPSVGGVPQADAMRPLGLPAVLVGDPRLGGVSGTLAALDALALRGYQVPAVVFFDAGDALLENAATVRRIVDARGGEEGEGLRVFCAPALPPGDVPLDAYLSGSADFFGGLLRHMLAWHDAHLAGLEDMSARAAALFWYPFTQHASLTGGAARVTAIDSAHGNTFSAYDPATRGTRDLLDGVGSWWTTGLGHGDAGLARAVAAAAGRYGHVMHAEAAHRPAYDLARALRDGPGASWAARVFFSDNGSTAVEAALKMAFRRRAAAAPARARLPARVAALAGGYHGDTLGAMSCAAASAYNARQTPWYADRTLSLRAPPLALVRGVWTAAGETFAARGDAFAASRDGARFDADVAAALDAVVTGGEADLGALLLEPVMQGAGGMRLVDPAYQRALVRGARARGVPVVFDEVFSGLWRLGAESGAALLGVAPDVACYGKLLTGGVAPLAATLASADVFDAFLGGGKEDALLHGHSYSAHAVGCAAGVEALARYRGAPLFDAARGVFGEFWDEERLRGISCARGVESVTAMGTVVAVQVRGEGEGYAATGSVGVARALRERGVFARPLGNVVYLMCSPVTERAECDWALGLLEDALARALGWADRASEA